MSRSVELFIQSHASLEELAHQLGVIAKSKMTPTSDGAWTLRKGDVVAQLTEHQYADDGNLAFSNYPYALSARIPSGSTVLDHPAVLLFRDIAQGLQRSTSMPAMLVLDLQHRLAAATRAGEGDAQ